MADAKIEFKIGNIAFAAEGDKAWLAEQLDKILDRATQLGDSAQQSEDNDSSDQVKERGKTLSLGKFLTSNNANAKQTEKFLATAVWLDERAGKRGSHSTADITKALRDNHQSKLNNPAHSLNLNVKKGFCEKSGKQFFVTDEGRKSLKA